MLVAGIESGGHLVAIVPIGDALAHRPLPDVAIVDAAKDLARGRDACRAIRDVAGRLTLLAVVAADHVEAIAPDWGIDSFIVDGAPADEALARIRLALGSQAGSETAIRVGDLAIDPETYQVRLRGRPLDLTYKEFQLLAFIAQRPGRVFSRNQLLQEVWGYDFFGGTRTVDVHVRRLRAKLGAEHEAMIATVRNVGYKLETPARGVPGGRDGPRTGGAGSGWPSSPPIERGAERGTGGGRA
ncbi:MAG: response regulator transcription factor [Acidobacteria bacterium]|nr:response regulator transcription factor [Acidobacteriota bacterium]